MNGYVGEARSAERASGRISSAGRAAASALVRRTLLTLCPTPYDVRSTRRAG